MAAEIERKFLVVGDGWKAQATDSTDIQQAYLATTAKASVRVRIKDGAKGIISIKSAASGTTRSEFEYDIPLEDARQLMQLRSGRMIEKRRHTVPNGNATWEVDVFGGAHKGLIIAEIELPSADASFERPAWLGQEVTDDQRYYNATLALES
jgi:adenylate cyclase